MVINLLGIINTNDKRYDYFVNNLKEEYIYSKNFKDFLDIDTLILPLFGVDSFLFIKDTNINLMDICTKNQIKKIICGKKNEFLERFCCDENIKLVSYLESDYYTWINSRLTAEGLIRKIMNDINDSLLSKKILILGYGYCGKALYKYLREFCPSIDIYARDYHDQKELYCNNISLNKLDNFNYDIIINTIDSNIIKKEDLVKFKKDSLIYDISSYPYGFESEILDNKLLNVNIIPKIPTLFMPKEAGKVLYDWYIKEKLVS